MVGALGGVTICHEGYVSAGGDEAQIGDRIQRRRAFGVGKEAPAQCGRKRTRIVHLHEIVIGQEQFVGQPLVDLRSWGSANARTWLSAPNVGVHNCQVPSPARPSDRSGTWTPNTTESRSAPPLASPVVQVEIIPACFQTESEMNSGPGRLISIEDEELARLRAGVCRLGTRTCKVSRRCPKYPCLKDPQGQGHSCKARSNRAWRRRSSGRRDSRPGSR